MFYRITESLRRFMQGRHGLDQLSIALLVGAMAASLLTSLLRWRWLALLYWVLIILCLLRTLSRNHQKRYAENQVFLSLWAPFQRKFSGLPQQMNEKKVYAHFKCPSCGQKLRLPRGKGLVVVTCSKCKTEFQKKT